MGILLRLVQRLCYDFAVSCYIFHGHSSFKRLFQLDYQNFSFVEPVKRCINDKLIIYYLLTKSEFLTGKSQAGALI